MVVRPSGRVMAAVVGACSTVVVVAGCGPLLTASAGSGNPNSEATIAVLPAAGSQSAPVLEPVVVSAEKGRLTSVSVMGDSGQVAGTVAPDGSKWTTNPGTELKFGTTYRVTATAVDAEGRPTAVTDSFATVKPANTVSPSVNYVSDYGTYGVGMPIIVDFGQTVADSQKAEIENRLHLTSSNPVEGAWSWNSDSSQVTFRPVTPWPAYSHVTMNADVYGVKINSDTYANSDLTLDFNIGRSVVMSVDQSELQLHYVVDGAEVKTIPVTLGKPGYETHSGTKVIMSKDGTVIMDAGTYGVKPGDPEYYKTPIEYSMRLTNHGEFLHANPAAAGAFGNYPASHGCISMTTENARVLFNESLPGDVVIVTGTGHPSSVENGIGVWNASWSDWLANSATGVRTVGPTG